jgi:hypothetical protein
MVDTNFTSLRLISKVYSSLVFPIEYVQLIEHACQCCGREIAETICLSAAVAAAAVVVVQQKR